MIGGDQIESEMVGACSTYGGRGKVKSHIRFWWGDLRERDQLEDLGVDVWMIINWI